MPSAGGNMCISEKSHVPAVQQAAVSPPRLGRAQLELTAKLGKEW